jgi:hypothetical protein
MLKNITVNGKTFNLGDRAVAADKPLRSGWMPIGTIERITNNVVEVRCERDPGYAAAGVKAFILPIGDFAHLNEGSIEGVEVVEMIQKSGIVADEAVQRLIRFIEAKGMIQDLHRHVQFEMLNDIL